MVSDVFEFVVSRRALTKNIAQKLEPLDIIHFQAMQSKTINNIKKNEKWENMRKNEETRVLNCTPCMEIFCFLRFAQILDRVYGSRCFWVCRIAARNGKKSCTKAQNPWYHWISEGWFQIDKSIQKTKSEHSWENRRKREIFKSRRDMTFFDLYFLHKSDAA